MTENFNILDEGPVATRGIQILKEFSLCHPQATHECPQTISAHSVQPFGWLWENYIWMSCFIV